MIAAAVGKSERYVSQVIQAAFLAPDLIEAVLEGCPPTQLTLAELRKDLPWDWNEQRRRFADVPCANRTPRDPESAAR
jgi:site-specific DNA recombinase